MAKTHNISSTKSSQPSIQNNIGNISSINNVNLSSTLISSSPELIHPEEDPDYKEKILRDCKPLLNRPQKWTSNSSTGSLSDGSSTTSQTPSPKINNSDLCKI